MLSEPSPKSPGLILVGESNLQICSLWLDHLPLTKA